MARTERNTLTRQQESYLEWLLTPKEDRDPKTKKAWADTNGVHQNTLTGWEKNKTFSERWALGVKGLTQSPERTQALLDSLYIKGISGDTKSAELYLKATGQMATQTNVNLTTKTDVKSLSDDELQSLILEMSQKQMKESQLNLPEIKLS